jgi:putative endonuclease
MQGAFVFMAHYVYVIYSERLNRHYKGVTTDVLRRLTDHNSGRNASTANKGPWKLRFVRSFPGLTEALQEEKRLKRTNTRYLHWLFQQDFNEVEQFI